MQCLFKFSWKHNLELTARQSWYSTGCYECCDTGQKEAAEVEPSKQLWVASQQRSTDGRQTSLHCAAASCNAAENKGWSLLQNTDLYLYFTESHTGLEHKCCSYYANNKQFFRNKNGMLWQQIDAHSFWGLINWNREVFLFCFCGDSAGAQQFSKL